MDRNRRQYLWSSLTERLASEAAEKNYTPLQRLIWLAEHVEEYVDRWLGLLELGSWPWSEIIEHDLFEVIAIGSDLLSKELARVDAPRDVYATWLLFLARLGEIRVDDGGHRAPLLLDAIRDVRATLMSGEP